MIIISLKKYNTSNYITTNNREGRRTKKIFRITLKKQPRKLSFLLEKPMSGQTDEYFELLSSFATEERNLAYLFSYKQTAKSNARFIRKKIIFFYINI